MPLLVTVNAQEANVGLDFAHIVRNDNGNLGITGGTASYAETIHDFADDRMDKLINHTSGISIVVTGVTNTFVITGTGDPSLDGHPITDAAGLTSRPSSINSAGTGANPGSTISVIYDVTGCGGSGYCCYDTGGHSISFPTDVLLFHELAHAFHWANNDFSLASPEPQAENDENQLRTLEGITLRDPNNHAGGCGTCPTGKSNGCFIVTAAYGSPWAPEVEAFRQLRDKLLRRSVWGDEFFATLHSAYYRFSADVATAMDDSPLLRASIGALVVQPLTSFLELLKDYLRGGWCDEQFVVNAAARLDETAWDAAAISSRLEGFLNGAVVMTRVSPPPAGDTASDPISVLDYLFAAISGAGALNEHVRWGLVETIALYWSTLALIGDGSDAERAATSLLRSIDEWLARCPIPKDLGYYTAEIAAEDLALLRLAAFIPPAVRHTFGQRLLATLGPAVGYDLRSILDDLGYLPPNAAAKGIPHGHQ